jgi:hypothetical protein
VVNYRRVAAVPRYRSRPCSGGARECARPGAPVTLVVVTVRCLFCLAHYAATMDGRIPCPACKRVEAEP